jgi:phage terminase large subunit-like protein
MFSAAAAPSPAEMTACHTHVNVDDVFVREVTAQSLGEVPVRSGCEDDVVSFVLTALRFKCEPVARLADGRYLNALLALDTEAIDLVPERLYERRSIDRANARVIE